MTIRLAASTTEHGIYNRRLFCKYSDKAPKINVANISVWRQKIVQNHENRHVLKLRVGNNKSNFHPITSQEDTERSINTAILFL